MGLNVNLNLDFTKGKLLLKIPGQNPIKLFEADLSAAAKKELDGLKKAAADIEGVFVKQMLAEMAPKDIAGSGQMGDFIRDQYIGAISNQIGKTGAIGIGKILKEKMTDQIYRQEAGRKLLDQQKKSQKVDEKS